LVQLIYQVFLFNSDQYCGILFLGQVAANETTSDDDSDSDDGDECGDGLSSSFSKEKISSEIKDSMVKLVVVSVDGSVMVHGDDVVIGENCSFSLAEFTK
jgi:hypothetical protein